MDNIYDFEIRGYLHPGFFMRKEITDENAPLLSV